MSVPSPISLVLSNAPRWGNGAPWGDGMVMYFIVIEVGLTSPSSPQANRANGDDTDWRYQVSRGRLFRSASTLQGSCQSSTLQQTRCCPGSQPKHQHVGDH